MRVPLSWLAEYTDLPGTATAEDVMAELVKVGLEEEGTHRFDVKGPLVVGQVLEFVDEPQANGKTIRWCQVQVAPNGQSAADGGDSVRGIVCGASNFAVGDKVVVCLPGSVLPGNFEIAARSTYGHISDGMLASGRELTLNDDHTGIIRLHELGLDPKVGSDAIELLHLDEQSAEINVTPDRGYCLSIRGVAREYSHATKADFRDPKGNAFVEAGHGFEITVDDDAPIRDQIGCNRFVVRSVRGVDPTRPTPPWMVARLRLAGMRSISLIVDITNYTMLELGQPIHAYDLDKVKGGLTVRRAKKGETLRTLDGQERKLHPEDLLITDQTGPIGLAGVMGGESTEVSAETVNILIEAANFDPVSIARTARRHKLPSEAAKRYERGVDPMLADNAAARVVQLLEVHALGSADSLGGEFRQLPEITAIWLPAGFAEQLVGVSYSAEQISQTLSEIGCIVSSVEGGFEVVPPSWRYDLKHKTDLVEEIARIIGYDQIPSRIPVAPPGRGLTRAQRFRRQVANALAATGHTEVLNYPFLSSEQNSWFKSPGGSVVRLANPLQDEFGELRLSLLPGLISAAQRNLSRGNVDLALFEEGLVFHPDQKQKGLKELPVVSGRPTQSVLDEIFSSIPKQPRHLAALFIGNRVPQQAGIREIPADYRDAIQAVEIAASSIGLTLEFSQATPRGFHPGRSAEVLAISAMGKIPVGVVGELEPALAKSQDLPRRVAAFEINLDALFMAAPALKSAAFLGTLPAATQDLSLVVDQQVSASQLRETVAEGAGELLESIRLVDDYRGPNIAPGHKSLTFALVFRAPDRTLTQAEASAARDSAVELAHTRFGATLRA